MMSWCRKNIVGLYLILLGLHCWCILMGFDNGRFYSKLMLLPMLMGMFLIKLPKNPETGWALLLLPMMALTSSYAGDLFLTFKGDLFFLLGMVSFMLTHIVNTIYFIRLNGIKINKLKHALLAFWVTGIAGVFELAYLKDDLGAYFVPVIVYSVLISIMVIAASNLVEASKFKHLASSYFVPGAALFFLSDGILALNKFNFEEPLLDILVMLTYGLAQLLLVRGYYKTVRLKKRGNSHPHHDQANNL